MQTYAEQGSAKSTDFPVLSQLPSPPLAILYSRYTNYQEYLVFFGRPAMDYELVESDSQVYDSVCYLHSAYICYTPAKNVRDVPYLLKYYKRKQTYQAPFPVAVLSRYGRKLAFFRFFEGDFYVFNYESVKMQKIAVIKHLKPSFEPSYNFEGALAKFLVFDDVGNAAFYASNRNGFQRCVYDGFYKSAYKSCWCGDNIELADMIVQYVYYGGTERIAVVDEEYYYTSQKMTKGGVLCSRQPQDQFYVTYFTEKDTIPEDYGILITRKIIPKAEQKTRILLLQNAIFSQNVLDFLLPGVSISDPELAFQSLEIGNLNSAFSNPNLLPIRYKLARAQKNSIRSSLLFKYYYDLFYLARTRRLTEDDEALKQLLSHTVELSHLDFVTLSASVLAHLLSNIWLDGQDIGARGELLVAIIDTLFYLNVNYVSLVVPENCVGPVAGVLKTACFYDIESYVQSSSYRKILMLTEHQVAAYALLYPVKVGPLPGIVILPFVSCRNIEVLTEKCYAALGQPNPLFYAIACENSIEIPLLQYRYGCGASIKEFTELYHHVSECGLTKYNDILKFIQERGFSGNYVQGQFDYAQIGLPGSTRYSKFIDRYALLIINFYNYNELIVQAALPYFLYTNVHFNLDVLARFYQCEVSSYIYIRESQGFTINNVHYGYYCYNTDHHESPNFYAAAQFLDASCLQSQAALLKLIKERVYEPCGSPETTILEFLRRSQQFRPSDSLTSDRRYRYNYKTYYILPATPVPMGQLEYIAYIYKNAPLEKAVTLCERCSGDGRLRCFGKTCDLCGAAMDYVADDWNVFRPVSEKYAWRVDHFFCKYDPQSPPADFIINSMLCAVYSEGLHYEQPILLKNFHIPFSEGSDELLRICALRNPGLVRAALEILNNDRYMTMAGIVPTYTAPAPIMHCVLRALIADSLLEFYGASCAALSTDEVPDISLDVALRHAVPLALSGLAIPEMHVDRRAHYQGSLYEYFCAVADCENVRMWRAYNSKLQIMQFYQRFDASGYTRFIENVMLCCRRQKDFGFEPSEELLQSPIFGTRFISNDNAIILNCLNGVISPLSQVMSYIAIYYIRIPHQKPSAPQVMKAIAFILRGIQRLTFYAEIPYNTIADSLQQHDQERLLGTLERLSYPGFSIVVKYCVADFFLPAEPQVIVEKSPALVRMQPMQRKIVQNHHEIRQQARNAVDRSIDRSMAGRSMSQPVVPNTPGNLPSSSSIVTQRNVVPSAVPPVIYQYQIPTVIPYLPITYPGIYSPGVAALYAGPAPMYQGGANTAQTPQYMQYNMQYLPQNRAVLRAPPPIHPPPPPASAPVPPPQLYAGYYPGDFFDAALHLGRNKVVSAVQRIINHYSCRSYYFRRNLLYVPQVQYLSARDALPHVLGLSLKSYMPGPNEESDFLILLHILTNDFRSYNYLKCQNVHKFCTIFNEMAKQKLESVSYYPALPLYFYDAQKCCVLHYWVLKRTLQAECDLSRGNVVVFAQDPVFGVPLNEIDKQTVLSPPPRRYRDCDLIFSMGKSELDEAFREAYSVCERFSAEERNKQIMYLVKIGIGTGSTPLETFYRFIQKGDPLQIATLLSSLVRLLSICAARGCPFPYKVPNVTENAEQVYQSIYRLEHMRFLHIKLQYFDFLYWLDRLLAFKGQEMQEDERKQIKIAMDNSLSCNVTLSHHKWAEDLDDRERRVVEWIGAVASEIDNFNQCLWVVDSAFNRYISESDYYYNMLRNFKLERFGINDFNQSQVGRAWEITMYQKLLFISLFGNSKTVLYEMVTRGAIKQADLDFVDQLFNILQQQWSRLHDFILMHIITDMGYTEAMMQSIVGYEAKYKSKHVEFLRHGFFASEDRFQLERTNMYNTLCRILTYGYNQRGTPLLPEYPYLFACIQQTRYLMLPTPPQIADAIAQLREYGTKLIEQQPISKEMLTRRVERLAHALRCERILTCDPLYKYLSDKAVQIVGPQARMVHLLTCEKIEYLKLPVRRQTLSRAQQMLQPIQRLVPQQIPPQAQQSMYNQSAHYNASYKPATHTPAAPSAYRARQVSVGAEDSSQLTPIPHNSSMQGTPVQRPAMQRGRSQPHVAVYKSVEMPHGAKRAVQNTKLSFYMENQKVVYEFIADIIAKAGASQQVQDLDLFLFYLSSCQKTTAEEWGRLYSFIIVDEPISVTDAQYITQQTLQYMKEFATYYGMSSRSEDVFKFLYSYIYDYQKADSHKYDDIAYRFVESQLNVAYYNAFMMRRAIIERSADRDAFKTKIRDAFQNMQVMNYMPLNRLIQRNDNKNKRKMALATYFFLAVNPE